MKVFYSIIIAAVMVCAFSPNGLAAEESTDINLKSNRYTIVSSCDRTLLLDTVTGKTWRYFNNALGDGRQGWEPVTIYQEIYKGKQFYKTEPKGETLSYPINK